MVLPGRRKLLGVESANGCLIKCEMICHQALWSGSGNPTSHFKYVSRFLPPPPPHPPHLFLQCFQSSKQMLQKIYRTKDNIGL
jgi:hypothetical protein